MFSNKNQQHLFEELSDDASEQLTGGFITASILNKLFSSSSWLNELKKLFKFADNYDGEGTVIGETTITSSDEQEAQVDIILIKS